MANSMCTGTPGVLPSMGSQRVRHDRATNAFPFKASPETFTQNTHTEQHSCGNNKGIAEKPIQFSMNKPCVTWMF